MKFPWEVFNLLRPLGPYTAWLLKGSQEVQETTNRDLSTRPRINPSTKTYTSKLYKTKQLPGNRSFLDPPSDNYYGSDDFDLHSSIVRQRGILDQIYVCKENLQSANFQSANFEISKISNQIREFKDLLKEVHLNFPTEGDELLQLQKEAAEADANRALFEVKEALRKIVRKMNKRYKDSLFNDDEGQESDNSIQSNPQTKTTDQKTSRSRPSRVRCDHTCAQGRVRVYHPPPLSIVLYDPPYGNHRGPPLKNFR